MRANLGEYITYWQGVNKFLSEAVLTNQFDELLEKAGNVNQIPGDPPEIEFDGRAKVVTYGGVTENKVISHSTLEAEEDHRESVKRSSMARKDFSVPMSARAAHAGPVPAIAMGSDQSVKGGYGGDASSTVADEPPAKAPRTSTPADTAPSVADSELPAEEGQCSLAKLESWNLEEKLSGKDFQILLADMETALADSVNLFIGPKGTAFWVDAPAHPLAPALKPGACPENDERDDLMVPGYGTGTS